MSILGSVSTIIKYLILLTILYYSNINSKVQHYGCPSLLSFNTPGISTVFSSMVEEIKNQQQMRIRVDKVVLLTHFRNCPGGGSTLEETLLWTRPCHRSRDPGFD